MRRTRVAGLAMLATLAASDVAVACIAQPFERTIFFDEVPAGSNAATVVRVTITAVTETKQPFQDVGTAQVDEVIKGQVDSKTINVVVSLTSCGPHLHNGDSGIVMGTLRQGAEGVLELVPIAQTFDERDNRRKAKLESPQ